jgi:co-chaperonin GroES (HSP10)
MKAKGYWILVCRHPIPEEHRVGRIIIPSNYREEEYFEGSIVSVGERSELQLAVGDYVLVRNDRTKLNIGTTKRGEIFAVDDDSIIAVVEEDEDVD